MNKKNSLIYIAIIIIILGAAGYYFFIRKPAEPIVWDGTYTMAGNLACEGNFPGLTTVPMNSSFAVSNNNIMEPTINKIYPIDEDGKSTEAFEQTANGVTTKVNADYQFYEEDGTYKFTADGAVTLSGTDKTGKALSSTCTGTITGAKQ